MKRQGAVLVEEEQRGIACVVCLAEPARAGYYTCSDACQDEGRRADTGRYPHYSDRRVAEAQAEGRARGWRA